MKSLFQDSEGAHFSEFPMAVMKGSFKKISYAAQLAF